MRCGSSRWLLWKMRSRREGNTTRFTTSTRATASSTKRNRSHAAVLALMVREAMSSANVVEKIACTHPPGVQQYMMEMSASDTATVLATPGR